MTPITFTPELILVIAAAFTSLIFSYFSAFGGLVRGFEVAYQKYYYARSYGSHNSSGFPPGELWVHSLLLCRLPGNLPCIAMSRLSYLMLLLTLFPHRPPELLNSRSSGWNKKYA